MFQFEAMERKLRQLNSLTERAMPILTPTGVLLGLLLGSHVSWMKPSVTFLFSFLTFCGALGINGSDFFTVLKKPKPIFLFLLIANILMPCFAWAVANLFFPSLSGTVTGYILLMAIPTAVSGYIWASIYKGNGALSLTMVLVSTALAPFMTPFTVRLLARTAVSIDTNGMILSLVQMVVIPSVIGVLINTLTKGKVNEHVTPSIKPFSKITLLMVIVINTSQVADRLLANASWQYLPIALLCAAISATGFPIAYWTGRMARLPKADNVSLTFATALRNISAALVLAIDYFPPETTLPVIFGIVFQQTICATMGYLLFGRNPIR
jgi:tagaturonate reductase